MHRQWQPRIRSIEFDGATTARPTQQVTAALKEADMIIICPSNPFVSVNPILTLISAPLAHIGKGTGSEGRPILAVSPIVGGEAIKGPAAKMFAELGFEPSALAVAQYYRGIITHFVLDRIDAAQESAIQSLGIRTFVTNTLMKSTEDRVRLAGEILNLAVSP